MISDCCGAEALTQGAKELGICPKCHKHCAFIPDDEELEHLPPLKACPHCGAPVTLIVKPSLVLFVCSAGSACHKSGLISCCFRCNLVTAVAAWNRRSP